MNYKQLSEVEAPQIPDELEEETNELPEGAEVIITEIGTIDNGIDGSDQYVLLTRKDDDITLAQAHTFLLGRYYRECTRPGGYFCTSVRVVFAAYSKDQVIGTIQHRFDV